MGAVVFLVLMGTAADVAYNYDASRKPVRMIHRIDRQGSHLINAEVLPDGKEIEEEDETGREETPAWDRAPKSTQLRQVLREKPGKNKSLKCL